MSSQNKKVIWDRFSDNSSTKRGGGTPPLPPGGGGGDNEDMEKRVQKLEQSMMAVSDRLTKIETRLEHMPTKADLSDAVHTQTKWVVGIGFTLMMVGIAASKLI